MLLTQSFSTAPYPGLRPFEAEECDIFFGREKQTDELLGKLQHNRFLAVIGPSGCGKSSLVRAGLIAALETGFIVDAGSRWRVARMRPGDRPMFRLAESLLAPTLLGPERGHQPDAALFLEAGLLRGPLGLLETASESGLCRDSNLLVLVDQFEEVFRFRAQGSPDEADAFVALLLATAAQTTLPIYVIITMRSDFLGDCSQFRDLPEAINRSAYLIPRLTREECAAAITGPARVFGGDIEPALLNRLLNDFGPDPDQLPLLQHALMRMWFRRVGPSSAGPSDRTVLTIGDYETLGGLPRALSDHADEVMRELTADQQRLVRIIFQRLTERGTGKRDTRAPAHLADIARVAGVDVSQLVPVIEAFRAPGCCFLTPLEGPLEPDTLIDIGHESLIRQWKQLAEWVEEEAVSARVYGRLRDTARLWEAGQAGLWSNPDLARAVQWKEQAHPNEPWATRYGQPGDYARAMKFLEASQAEHRRREMELEATRERALRRARHLSMALGGVILAILAGFAGYWYGWVREYGAHYNTFTKVEGVPRGIGALSAQQVRNRPWSLRIVKAGRFGQVRRMEAVDSQGRLTPRHSVGTYLSDEQDVLQRREVRWEFLYDARDRVAHEVAYDRAGQRVWALIYSPSDDDDGRVRLAHFVGADGYPRPTKGYGGGYVRIEYSPQGYESLITYRNALGEPRAGLDKAFGRRQEFDAEGRLIEMVSVGPDGQPMIDEAGNAGLRITRDAQGYPVEYLGTDAAGAVTTLRDGWSKARVKYDSSGNRTELTHFDEQDRPTLDREGYHRLTEVIDERGLVTELGYWDVDGSPTLVAGCHRLQFALDDRGNVVRETCVGVDGNPAPNDRGITVTVLTYDDRDNAVEVAYTDAAGQPVFDVQGHTRIAQRYDEKGNRIETAHYGLNGQPVLTQQGYSRVTSEYDAHNNETARAYFGTDGRPVVITDTSVDRSNLERAFPLSYAKLERRYDENGNLSYEAYFDVDGKPRPGPEGYAALRATYDLSGNRSEVTYFGMRGERVMSNAGYAGWRPHYDSLGRRTRIEYLGLRGELVLSDEKIAGFTITHDAQGNEVEESYFGADGQPLQTGDGYATLRTHYDRRRQPVEYEYLGTDGKPAVRFWNSQRPENGGYARRTLKRDGRNRVLEHAFFGPNGERVAHPEGWARVVNRYDLRGTDPVEIAYFDVTDRPTSINGYHATRQRLDMYGRIVEVTYYDAEGRPVATRDGYARLVNGYDSHGRRTEQAIFAADGSPAVTDDGIHKWLTRYDERGQRIERRNFGPKDTPVRMGGVFQHYTTYRYDERGNTVELAHFDVEGNPAPGPDISGAKPCTRWTGQYDADGKLTSSHCELAPARSGPPRARKPGG